MQGLFNGKPKATFLDGKPKATFLDGKPKATFLNGKPKATFFNGKPKATFPLPFDETVAFGLPLNEFMRPLSSLFLRG